MELGLPERCMLGAADACCQSGDDLEQVFHGTDFSVNANQSTRYGQKLSHPLCNYLAGTEGPASLRPWRVSKPPSALQEPRNSHVRRWSG